MEKAAFDVSRREKLFATLDPAQRNRARKLFAAGNAESGRSRVWADYRSALDLEGDGGRGQKIFEEKCGRCHLPRKGKRVGPDLARVKGATGPRLLEAILNPSRDIDPGYTNYIITTRDGRIHDGVIGSETPGTLTLRHGEEEDETLLRANIERIRASSVSLMPDGFERELNRQDLADVIAFLKGSGLHQH